MRGALVEENNISLIFIYAEPAINTTLSIKSKAFPLVTKLTGTKDMVDINITS